MTKKKIEREFDDSIVYDKHGKSRIVKAGEWINPKRKYCLMVCPNCGTTHKTEFALIKDKNNRATIIFREWPVEKRKKTTKKKKTTE